MKRASSPSGTATAKATASHRTGPLWASAHHTAAAVTIRLATATTSRARLRPTPAAKGGTSRAAAMATKASRASQRWMKVVPPGP